MSIISRTLFYPLLRTRYPYELKITTTENILNTSFNLIIFWNSKNIPKLTLIVLEERGSEFDDW